MTARFWRPLRRGLYHLPMASTFPDDWSADRRLKSWERFWGRSWPLSYCAMDYRTKVANDTDHCTW